jgi:hypothetical protein
VSQLLLAAAVVKRGTHCGLGILHFILGLFDLAALLVFTSPPPQNHIKSHTQRDQP